MDLAINDSRVHQFIPDSFQDVVAGLVAIYLSCASMPSHQLNMPVPTQTLIGEMIFEELRIGEEPSWFLHSA